ncbi:RNA polymerase sigma factor [Streptomyces sp. NPDC007355]|uniref:RNA polymerase sigma factor n=1 Tax=Streptomyces sp. NPDC007355 TaxID=3364778 RepID=UPI0036913FB6
MTISGPVAPACLGCGTPLGAAVADPGTGEERLYLDAGRWCSRCWRYLDEWERFYRLYRPRLFSFCLVRLRGVLPAGEDCAMLADEIVQETMIVAHRKFSVWELPERALWQTARRLIYARCSDYTFMTGDGARVTVRNIRTRPWEEHGGETQSDPSDAVVHRIVLRYALEKLPVEHRQAVIVHKAIGVPAVEAGHVLDRPASTVKTQAQSGLRRLRKAAAEGALVLVPVGGVIAAMEALRDTRVGDVTGQLFDTLTEQPLLLAATGVGLQHAVAFVHERVGRIRSGGRARATGAVSLRKVTHSALRRGRVRAGDAPGPSGRE